MDKIKVGIIGCGNISSIYLTNLTKIFKNVEVVACADIAIERAREKAEQFSIPKVYSVNELLCDPEIQLVVNLTIPASHAEICIAAIEAGKHVYTEKPFATTREDGEKILRTAIEKNVLVGCAPDTFLGAGLQTSRKLINDGWIGQPIAATAFMMCHGHESWHPDPEFYYKKGGGPMFDMGPYYLTALISLMGPVRRVSASTNISFAQRTITSEPMYGQKIDVEVPTHVAGVMDFENGAIATLITSFDVWSSQSLPFIEIYGTDGTLSVPDPNSFGGPVYVCRKDMAKRKKVPLLYDFSENSRGLGVSDMARAILTGEQHRATGEMGYHVLDIMHAFHDSSKDGKHVNIQSSCKKPTILPFQG